MSKIYNVLSIAVFLFVSLISGVNAQEPQASIPTQEAVVIANVNVYEPTIISQENGVLKVGFDVSNDADTAQADILYGLDIIKASNTGQTVVDSFVATDALALAAHSQVHKEILYTIPPYLSGEYEIWVVSRATGGMLLGLGRAGTTTFSNTAPYVEILPETCLITVSGESTPYSLYQGVDVSSEETLSFTCTVESHFETDIVVTPAFSTHKRTRYGDVVNTVSATPEPITLAAGEKKVVALVIPKATVPQAYDVSVSLTDASQKTVSNEIIAHYVLRGASATIQTATLDKDLYRVGETLSAQVMWTPSADSFADSRAGAGTVLPNTTLVLSVVNAAGVLCIDPVTRPLTNAEQSLVITAPVVKDCNAPEMSISLRDDAGNILDSRGYGAPESSKTAPEVSVAPVSESSQGMITLIIIITIVSSLMILYVLMTMRAIMRGDMVAK